MKYFSLYALVVFGLVTVGCASNDESVTRQTAVSAVVVSDEYRNGVHVYEGEITSVSPCTEIEISVTERTTSEIFAEIEGEPFEGVCENGREGASVRFSAHGDSDAKLSVLYNGMAIPLTVERIPAQIVVSQPAKNSKVGGTVDIKGRARSDWFVGNRIRVHVADSNGKILSSGFAYSNEDMTEGYAPFSGTVSVPLSGAENGKLVFEKAADSDGNSDLFRVPVAFDSEIVFEGKPFAMRINEEKTFDGVAFRLARIGEDTRSSDRGTGAVSVRIEKTEPFAETIWLTTPDSDTEPISDTHDIVLRDVVSNSDIGETVVELAIISR